MNTIKPFTWSYSQLKNWETCPKRYYHLNVAKDIVEPTTSQLQEGNNLHTAFDRFITKGEPLPMQMVMHTGFLTRIRNAPGKVIAEQKLALTSTFQPSQYFGPNVWYRGVIDLTRITPEQDVATVMDWKTGKVADDMTQLQLCTALIFAFVPTVMRVKAALVFVNYNEVKSAEFVRDDLTEIWNEILPRVNAVRRARDTQEYPPTPSGLCKRYCPVMSCAYHGKGA